MIDLIWKNIEEIAAVLSVLILLWTAYEVRKATHANTYKAAFDIVQSEAIREARDTVMVALKDRPFTSTSWSEDEIKAARKVCQAYDAAGQIVRNRFLPTKIIADSWGPSLRESWRILSPFVLSFRAQINSVEYWDDYEWLAKEAEKYHKPLHTE